MLGDRLCVQTFSVYLVGRPFIQSDHRCLEWLDRMRDNNSRLIRSSLFLQCYRYHVVYHVGRLNGNVDGLLRWI